MAGIALGQVTPGPIVITAIFVRYQLAGLAGALVGTVAVFTPSFLMVLITVPYFDRVQQSTLLRRALRGILASFVGLLLAVAVQFQLRCPGWPRRFSCLWEPRNAMVQDRHPVGGAGRSGPVDLLLAKR